MVTETRRCAQCGNEIPDWSGGVCPVCGRITQGEKRFWRGARKRPRPRPMQRAAPYPLPVKPVERPKREKAKLSGSLRRRKASLAKNQLERGSRGWQRLEGFNRLLRDVYGRSVRLSHLLTKHGIPQAQTRRWRQDGLWLVRFLKRLERKLLMVLAEAMPAQDPRVLNLWYGLDGKGNRPIEEIAAELGIITVEVLVAQRVLLRYLQEQAGRAELERAVLITARETKGR
jgi:hypothetical protein